MGWFTENLLFHYQDLHIFSVYNKKLDMKKLIALFALVLGFAFIGLVALFWRNCFVDLVGFVGALERSNRLGALYEGIALIGEEGRAAIKWALSFLFKLRQSLAVVDWCLGLAWSQPITDLGFIILFVGLAFVILVLKWPWEFEDDGCFWKKEVVEDGGDIIEDDRHVHNPRHQLLCFLPGQGVMRDVELIEQSQ